MRDSSTHAAAELTSDSGSPATTSDTGSTDAIEPIEIESADASEHATITQPPPGGRRSDAPAPDGDAVTQYNQLAAFSLLSDAMADAAQSGHSRAAAGLKSTMRRTHDFDETRYGFRTFRHFLREAAAAGYVILDEPEEHGKVDVYVRGAAQTTTNAAPPAPDAGSASEDQPREHASTVIRQDLWEVFFDWRRDLLRYWDRTHAQAFVLTAEPRTGEGAAVARRRAEVLQRPGDFVAIEHVTLDQQIDWAREFVHLLPDVDRTPELQECLNDARPIAALTRYLREHQSLQRRWKNYRLRQVHDVIDAWRIRHGLTIDINGVVPGIRPLPLPSDLREHREPADIETTDPRAQILAAVERMTLADLLRLSIPAEYFLRS